MKTWSTAFGVWLFLVAGPACHSAAAAENGVKQYAFVSSQYIITAEIAGPHSFIFNFINLSDFVIVVQPNEFIYKGASGQFYIGQVYEQEHQDNRGESLKYSASVLLKGHSFTGLTIVGAFHEQDKIEELSVRIGAKRFYLMPLEKLQFDQLAAKIGDIDLQNQNSRAALQEANIAEMGTVKTTDGTSDWDKDWQNILRPDGVNPPRIIEHPEITPSDEARRKNIYGRVKLAAVINRNGGIQSIKVEKGLGHGLDQRAVEAVKNSWLFLPATRNGEVVETAILFDVPFPPPVKKP